MSIEAVGRGATEGSAASHEATKAAEAGEASATDTAAPAVRRLRKGLNEAATGTERAADAASPPDEAKADAAEAAETVDAATVDAGAVASVQDVVEAERLGGLLELGGGWTPWATGGAILGTGLIGAALLGGGGSSNTPPTATADTGAATEGGAAVTGSVATNDADADSDPLTYSLNAPVAGLTLNADGTWSFDPTNAAYNGLKAGQTQQVVANYTVSDGQGGTATSTLTITVTGTNDVPTATARTGTATEGGAAATGALAATDPDGDPLSYSLNAPVAGLTLNADGTWSFDPTHAAYNGLKAGETRQVVADYTVSDGNGGTATSTLTITVTGTNDAPVAVADVNSATEGGAVVTGSVAANDSDPDGDPLTYSLSAPVAGLTLNADGTWSFDPASAAYNGLKAGQTQQVVADYTVSDGQGGTASSTLTITVTGTNDVPTATADSYTTAEDTALVIPAAGVLTNDADPDGDPLSATLVSGPANGVLILNADGSFTYTPDADYNGSDSFTYKVDDGTVDGDTVTVSLTVTAVNDAPTILAPAGLAATEDAAQAITGVTVADLDAGSAPLTVTLSVPSGALSATSGGGVTVGGTASSLVLTGTAGDINAFIAGAGVTYLPAANATGDVTLTVVADDGGATGADPGLSGTGSSEAATTQVTLTIAPVNDAPQASIAAATYGASEGAALSLKGQLSVSDVDAGAGAVTVTLTVTEGVLTVSAGGSGATVQNSGTGAVTITGTISQINALLSTDSTSVVSYQNSLDTPSANTTLTLSVDDEGNAGAGGAMQSSDTAVITVAAVNDAPVNVVPGAQSVNEDMPLVFSVANGNAIVVADTDAGGAPLTVTLAVAQGVLTLAQTTGLSVTGDGTGTIVLTGSATDVNAALDGLTYQGALNFNGSDTLQITTEDVGASGSGGSQTDVDTIALSVGPVNDLPVAADDPSGAMDEDDGPASFVVLANDALDPDAGASNTVSVNSGGIAVTGSAGAPVIAGSAVTATVETDGRITLALGSAFQALGAGEYADVTVPYTLTGDPGDTSTATLTVRVTGANDGPTAVADAFAMNENGVQLFAVAANDTDVDFGDVLAAVGVDPASVTISSANGTPVDPADIAIAVVGGQIQVDPGAAFDFLTPGQSETITFTYTVQDASGAQSTATVVLTVNGADENTAPELDLNAGGAGLDNAAAYTENAGAAALAPALTLSDVEGGPITGASVVIGAGRLSGDALTVDGAASGSSGGVSWSYDAGTGTLTLTGSA
ncbi:MAG: beta strand repeat-containing protein, partial [Brevundimonas sp.]